jgi:hypothetical protein
MQGGTGRVSPIEMLGQNGFADVPAPLKSYGHVYPDLGAQLDVLRRTCPTAPEVGIVEAHLDRALQARFTGNAGVERAELDQARQRLFAAVQGRTAPGNWTSMFWILVAVACVAAAVWWWKQDQRRKRRVALPQPIDDEDADDEPTDWVDGDAD